MNSVFLKSIARQSIPQPYESELIVGPVPRKGECGFRHTLDRLLVRPRKPSENVEAFTSLAVATYLADKTYRRSEASDGWTRDLVISVPTAQKFSSAIPILQDALRFLSGDRWVVEGRIEPVSIGARVYYKHEFTPDAICLFSGGTDSLTGAIDLLEAGKSVVLVSHFESGADAGVQKTLVRKLQALYGPQGIRHRPIQVCSPRTHERSTRARSLLFLALALMTASAFGDNIPVYIPENGFVAINIPLTGSRIGSYSTRTTHPAYLALVKAGLEAAAIRHDVVNPYLYQSKGETLQLCANKANLTKLLPFTVSCAKAGWARWERRAPTKHCGFCYPCLIRRAALHSMNADEPSTYVYDAIGTSIVLEGETLGRDLRCVLQAAAKYKSSPQSILLEIMKTGSIPRREDITRLAHAVATGLDEVTNLVLDKGCTEVKKYASL